jgi:hypothetical protein
MFWGIVFGSIGMGYAIYGKRQRHLLASACGIGLMILPIVISMEWVLIAVCAVLIALPLVLRRQ